MTMVDTVREKRVFCHSGQGKSGKVRECQGIRKKRQKLGQGTKMRKHIVWIDTNFLLNKSGLF